MNKGLPGFQSLSLKLMGATNLLFLPGLYPGFLDPAAHDVFTDTWGNLSGNLR